MLEEECQHPAEWVRPMALLTDINVATGLLRTPEIAMKRG